jgi:glycosyltransferase involved in cell wall biosynthesis
MAVYNGEKYLAEAIESILNQTFRDFEFIIIDDASTDNSLEILEKYQRSDERIHIYRNNENVGLGVSLQRAVDLASSEFIARMDADDICTPDRFEKQNAYLNSHHEICILGADHWLINDQGLIIGELHYPPFTNVIRWNMVLGNGLIVTNSATMIRKDILQALGGYGANRAAQDFELWSRTFDMQPLPIANLSEKILYYRQHAKTNTCILKNIQEEVAVSTRKRTIENLIEETISEDVVKAYRYTSLAYPDIEDSMRYWLKIYRVFVNRFNPEQKELKIIRREMVQRLSHYLLLNPFSMQKQGRISFNQAIKWLRDGFAKEVLEYKFSMREKPSQH